MSIYKKAVKQKLRIATTVGLLSVEQLWDLSINDLDNLAVQLEEEYKKSGKKSFVVKSSAKDKTLKLKFDIVVDILETKVSISEKASKAAETKAFNQRIDEIIARKKAGEMEEMSVEELEALRK